MPDFSIIAVTTPRGSDTSETEGVVADFDEAAEAKGYARRRAEETHGFAAQLDLDFDYSHVSVFTGDVHPEDADTQDEAFVGMWLFLEEGVEWASAEALRAETPAGAAAETAA